MKTGCQKLTDSFKYTVTYSTGLVLVLLCDRFCNALLGKVVLYKTTTVIYLYSFNSFMPL